MNDEYVKVLKAHLRMLLSGETQKVMINFNGESSCVIIPRTKYDFFMKQTSMQREKRVLRPEEFSKSQKTLLKVAHKIPIFNNLDTQEIISVTQHVKFLRFEKDEVLMHYHQSGHEVYFVLEGIFSVQVPDEESLREVAQIAKGTVLGEIAPVVKQNRSATVSAITEGAVVLSFTINFESQDVECETYKKINQNFVNILAQKLIQSNTKHC